MTVFIMAFAKAEDLIAFKAGCKLKGINRCKGPVLNTTWERDSDKTLDDFPTYPIIHSRINRYSNYESQILRYTGYAPLRGMYDQWLCTLKEEALKNYMVAIYHGRSIQCRETHATQQDLNRLGDADLIAHLKYCAKEEAKRVSHHGF